MKNLINHIIICGWNNSAEQVMKEFEKRRQIEKQDIVTVTLKSPDEIDFKKIMVTHGDFTKEGILNAVNIKKANTVLIVAEEIRGISAESMDARTFLACNMIHNINPKIHIVAQLLSVKNATVLTKTVKNIEIIVSDEITGGLLSNSIVSPGTYKLINTLVFHSEDNILRVPLSKLEGTFKSFKDLISYCRNPSRGWLPFALEKNGEFIINPRDNFQLSEGNTVFLIHREIDL